MMSFRFAIFRLAVRCSATGVTPKETCSWVQMGDYCHHPPTASRFTSITMRNPVFCRDSSRSADAFHAFIFHQLRRFSRSSGALCSPFDRNFMDDDGFTARFRVSFNFRAGANVHFATTGTVASSRYHTTVTIAAVGKSDPEYVPSAPFQC